MTHGTDQDLLAHAEWTLRRVPFTEDGQVPSVVAPEMPGEANSAGGVVAHGARDDAIPARVPGTVTGALRDHLGEDAAARAVREDPAGTVWEYRARVSTPGGRLRFTSDGVATVARLWVDGTRVHACDSAFEPWDVAVELPAGSCDVVLQIVPLTSVPVPRKPRARWLSPLVGDRSARWRRTPLTGLIDWPGALPVLGPWGGLRLLTGVDGSLPVDPEPVAVRAAVDELGVGRVSVDLSVQGGASTEPVDVAVAATVRAARGQQSVDGAEASQGDPGSDQRARHAAVLRSVTSSDADDSGRISVDLTVAHPHLWWPHGMGEQALYDVRVTVGGQETTHTVGFRTLAAEPRIPGRPGLALRLNDVPVFVRGAVWAGADPFEAAASPERIRARLLRLRDGGCTMIRLPGTGCYESPAFHRLCDELGLMVWQDVALGPLDPPDDPDWRAGLHTEIRVLASRLAPHPSTVVISGGTEVIQAPVLAGRPAEQWVPDVLLDELPRAVAESGADVIVVPSTPCSDAELDAAAHAFDTVRRDDELSASPAVPVGSPVDPSDGTAHYFGVGAYGRPLSDATVSDVQFAAECLAFAVPPEPAAVRAWFGSEGPLDHESSAQAWTAGLARDPGASWTFEDTCMEYVHQLFFDRDSDPDKALAHPARAADTTILDTHAARLEYQRAALAHVFHRTFATWRRAEASCRGGLVLAASSTAEGAGWGLLDVTGAPTAAWYGMRRACAPVAVAVLPEQNGLPVYVFNDRPELLRAALRITVVTVSGACQPPIDVPVEVPAHGERVVRADLLDGSFRDLDHAFGFGEREYDAVAAHLLGPDGALLARDVHLCGGPRRDHSEVGELSMAWVETGDDEWAVDVTADSLARFVALDLPMPLDGEDRVVALDGYVHILPGEMVRIRVTGPITAQVREKSRVRALGIEPAPTHASSR